MVNLKKKLLEFTKVVSKVVQNISHMYECDTSGSPGLSNILHIFYRVILYHKENYFCFEIWFFTT
jgi:hypothetical protein